MNVLGIFQAREIAGTLAGKILNVLMMCWVGTYMVLCPFPCDVLAVYWPGTPVLAPSACSSGVVTTDPTESRATSRYLIVTSDIGWGNSWYVYSLCQSDRFSAQIASTRTPVRQLKPGGSTGRGIFGRFNDIIGTVETESAIR